MAERNPKQDGSILHDCRPQTGKCPLDCNQCFYNRPGAFYCDIEKPFMPTLEELGDGIMRVNSGHDSNVQRDMVIKETEQYPKRFFNTSIPRFDFPGPVVFTANSKEEEPAYDPTHLVEKDLNNIMFVRLRVSASNLELIDDAVWQWMEEGIPIVLTFMAYYEGESPDPELYEWKKRHINSYFCPTKEFMKKVLDREKEIGGKLVTMCGSLESNYCKDCGNCETYYRQTMKHLAETNIK